MDVSILKYLPRINAALGFLFLLLLMSFLFFGRNISELRMSQLEHIFPDFYLHISNLSLSCLLLMTSGFIMLLTGSKFRFIAIVGVVLILANVFIETDINILNTPDPTDLIYGIAGVLIGMLFLLFVQRFGLQSNILEAGKSSPKEETQQQQQQQQQ